MHALDTVDLIRFHTQGRAEATVRILPNMKLGTPELTSQISIARLQALLAPVGTWS